MSNPIDKIRQTAYHQKKKKVYFAVGLTSVLIFGVWFMTLKYGWRQAAQNNQLWPTWPETTQEFAKWQQDLLNFGDQIKTDPDIEIETSPEFKIIDNPHNLSVEEINNLEETVFPKEKNAKKNKAD